MKVILLIILNLICVNNFAQNLLIDLDSSGFKSSTIDCLKQNLIELINTHKLDTLLISKSFGPRELVTTFPTLNNVKIAYIYQTKERFIRNNIKKISSKPEFSKVVELKWINNLNVDNGIVCIFDKNYLLSIAEYRDSLIYSSVNIEKGQIIDYVEYFYDSLSYNEMSILSFSYDHQDNDIIINFRPMSNPAERIEISFRNEKVLRLEYILGINSISILYKKCGNNDILNLKSFVIDFETKPENIYFKKIRSSQNPTDN